MWNFVQNFESNCDITHVKSKIKKVTGTIGIIYLNLLNENLFVYLNRACLSFCTYWNSQIWTPTYASPIRHNFPVDACSSVFKAIRKEKNVNSHISCLHVHDKNFELLKLTKKKCCVSQKTSCFINLQIEWVAEP